MSPRVRQVLKEAAERHGVTVQAVLGRDLTKPAVRARHDAMRTLRSFRTERDEDAFTYPMIGRLFGRHHTTVLQACAAGLIPNTAISASQQLSHSKPQRAGA